MVGRFQSIGIPLITAFALIMPVVIFLDHVGLINMRLADKGSFWSDYIAKIMSFGTHWVAHLWFLIVLMQYSIIFAAVSKWFGRLPFERAESVILARLYIVITALFVILAVYAALRGTAVSVAAHVVPENVLTTVALAPFVEFVPFFLIGACFQRMPKLFTTFRTFSWVVAIGAVVATCAYVFASMMDGPAFRASARVAGALCGILATSVLLSLFTQRVSGSSRVVDFLVASALVVLVHFPIVVGLGVLFTRVQMHVAIEAAIILTATYAAAYAFFMVVRRVVFLEFIFSARVKKAVA